MSSSIDFYRPERTDPVYEAQSSRVMAADVLGELPVRSSMGSETAGVGHPTVDIDPKLAVFTPEKFLSMLEELDEGECFHIVAGDVGARGETTVIGVSSYHAPISELVIPDRHKRHVGVSFGFLPDIESDILGSDFVKPYPHTEVSLTIPGIAGSGMYDSRNPKGYVFDAAEPDFRLLKANINVYSQEIPVQIVRVDVNDSYSDFWILKDTTPDEQT